MAAARPRRRADDLVGQRRSSANGPDGAARMRACARVSAGRASGDATSAHDGGAISRTGQGPTTTNARGEHSKRDARTSTPVTTSECGTARTTDGRPHHPRATHHHLAISSPHLAMTSSPPRYLGVGTNTRSAVAPRLAPCHRLVKTSSQPRHAPRGGTTPTVRCRCAARARRGGTRRRRFRPRRRSSGRRRSPSGTSARAAAAPRRAAHSSASARGRRTTMLAVPLGC